MQPQNYNSLSDIPSAQDNRRAAFPKMVADCHSWQELEACCDFLEREYEEHEKQSKSYCEGIRLIAERAKRLHRIDTRFADDVQRESVPSGWNTVETATV